MKNCATKDSEIKKLFTLVETYKANNKPISWAFKDYAKTTNRKQNSIRNLYYMQISVLNNNPQKAQTLGINLVSHVVQNPTPFSRQEELDMFKKINDLTNKGHSVRKACLILAGGNSSLMIRYQNKYRCMLNQNKTTQNNIIKMPTKKVGITDADIQSLFLGLVKLVKKNAVAEAKNQTEQTTKQNEVLLDKYLLDITNKNSEIENLRQQVLLYTQMNKKLRAQINCLKNKKPPDPNIANKNLKNFLEKATQNIVGSPQTEKA